MENYNRLIVEYSERNQLITQQNQSISSGPSGRSATVTLNLIYDALSANGKIDFNAASIGDFFSVSAADYASVFSSVTGVTKYIMTDSQMNEDQGDGISGGVASAISTVYGSSSELSEIPEGSYVIGFTAASRSPTNGTITPLISTTNASAGGTYTAISNSPVFLGDIINVNRIRQYYIRKNPPAPVSQKSYLGLVSDINRASTATFPTSWFNFYTSNSVPYSTWSYQFLSKAPQQQFLVTSTKSW